MDHHVFCFMGQESDWMGQGLHIVMVDAELWETVPHIR